MPLHLPELHLFPACVVGADVVVVVMAEEAVVALVVATGGVVGIIMEAKVSFRQSVELQQFTEQLV